MDDEEDDAPSYSHLSPSSSPPSPPISIVHSSAPLPPPSIHPSDSVTVATPAPHHQTLTLALPIQPPPQSAAGGREDCWSENATSVLIDAWGEHFLELNRGNLKQKQWQEVAEVVSSRDDYTKPPRSDLQCKNRIDTLKKRYKIEKSKISAFNRDGLSVSSSWSLFKRLDFLLGPIMKTPPSTPKHPSLTPVATAALIHFPQRQRTSMPMKRKTPSPLPPQQALSSSTSDSLLRPAKGGHRRVGMGGMTELAQAIRKFGEVYQRVESSKLQQKMEMEKQRMGFARELELQRMQFFMKTQMELCKLKSYLPPSGVGGGGGGSSSNSYLHHSRRRHHRLAGNSNINGTSG